MTVMNVFRILADLIHLVEIFRNIFDSHPGISLKTQICFFLVFVTRYLDLPWNILNPSMFHFYLASMKIIYIAATAVIIYYINVKYRSTYNVDEDGLPLYFILPPCLILSLLWNQDFTFFEILWAFSIYLEAVSIIPQLVMLQQTGAYRFFYLLNWIYRFAMEENYSQWIVWVSGAVQTILYLDFFYYYIKGQVRGESIALPTSTSV